VLNPKETLVLFALRNVFNILADYYTEKNSKGETVYNFFLKDGKNKKHIWLSFTNFPTTDKVLAMMRRFTNKPKTESAKP